MIEKFRPMLAVNADLDKINYPVLASAKIDGIRTLIIDGKPVTRMLKDIPNAYIRDALVKLFRCVPGIIDGELIVGENFQETSSAVMSFEGNPNFIYCVFDYVEDSFTKPFTDRINDLNNLLMRIISTHVVGVEHEFISNYAELQSCEEFYLSRNYEGLIIRSLNSPYKMGRSTVKEGYLLKIKRFEDAEAEIIGFEEQLHNANEAKTDALGHTDRSTCKENMIGKNTLGSLKVRDMTNGLEFSVGSGLNDELRKQIWENQASYLGRLITYKYQKSGVKELPRFPVFKGFRSKKDL
jgi:DNA ligase-1